MQPDIAAVARAAAMTVEVKKDSVRQVQSGDWRLTFTVAATDMPVSIITAPPGARYVLAVVAIGDDEQPILSGPSPAAPPAAAPAPEPQTPAKETDRRRSQDPVVQRCALLCKAPQFQRWMMKNRRPRRGAYVDALLEEGTAEEIATFFVRWHCEVKSRRDLAIDNDARDRWLALEEQYMTETGQRPWRRPDERRSA